MTFVLYGRRTDIQTDSATYEPSCRASCADGLKNDVVHVHCFKERVLLMDVGFYSIYHMSLVVVLWEPSIITIILTYDNFYHNFMIPFLPSIIIVIILFS